MIVQLTVDATLSEWPLLQCHNEFSLICFPYGCMHVLKFARDWYPGASKGIPMLRNPGPLCRHTVSAACSYIYGLSEQQL